MTNYQVGDFLIRIKNAALANIKEVSVKKSKMVLAIANALKSAGFLSNVSEEKGIINVRLAVFNKKPVVSDIKIMSKPGLRIYMNVDSIEKYKKPEVLILSTPKGIVTDKEAKKLRVGGELIAKII